MNKLTDAFIKRAKITNGGDEQEFADGGNLYLVLKQTKDGLLRYWKFRYRFGGKRPKLGLGSVEDVSLAQAREKAKALRQLLRDGIDPAVKREEEKAVVLAQELATEGGPPPETLRELFLRWKEDYLKNHRSDEGAAMEAMFENHVLGDGMGELKLSLMKRAHAKTILDRVAAKGKERTTGMARTTGMVLDALRQMFNWSAQWEWIDRDPTFGLKKRDWNAETVESERALSEDEIVQLAWRLKKSYTAARWKHACWFIMATGTRIEETMLTERSHINWSRSTWTIPVENQKTTNRKTALKPHVVHLSQFAKTHLEALLKMPNTEKYVFPARTRKGSPGASGTTDEKTLTKELKNHQGRKVKGRRCTTELLLEGGEFSPQDLRRTMSTLMQELRIDPHIIDKCQNHVIPGKIQRTYQRAELRDLMAEAWDKLGEKLRELSEMPDPEPDYTPTPPKARFLDVTDVEAVKAHEQAKKAAAEKKLKRKSASPRTRNSRVAG